MAGAVFRVEDELDVFHQAADAGADGGGANIPAAPGIRWGVACVLEKGIVFVVDC